MTTDPQLLSRLKDLEAKVSALQRQVTTEKLVLEDDTGKVRAELRIDKGVPKLVLFGHKAEDRTEISVDGVSVLAGSRSASLHPGSCVVIDKTADHYWHVQLFALPDGAQIILRDGTNEIVRIPPKP